MKLGEDEEYDQRQYTLMAENLRDFEDGKRGLGDLIANLKGLINALELVDDDWKSEFQTQFLNLEIVFAVACAKIEKKVPPDLPEGASSAGEIIDLAMIHFRNLINSRIIEGNDEFNVQ